MDDDQRIRDLQLQVISMRSELTITYSKLLKHEYQHFTNQLKNGICVIPEKLENFKLMHQPQLEKYFDTIMEVPTASETTSVTASELMQKATAVRRAQQILNGQR